MFQKLIRKFCKSSLTRMPAASVRRRQRARLEHSSLVSREGDWWFCRTTTAAARQMALRGAVVRVGREAEIYAARAGDIHAGRAGPWRRIPGAA